MSTLSKMITPPLAAVLILISGEILPHIVVFLLMHKPKIISKQIEIVTGDSLSLLDIHGQSKLSSPFIYFNTI